MIDTQGPSFICLLSSERSGSHLVTRMFDAHPGVCGPAPTYIGSDLLVNLHRYGALEGENETGFLNDMMALLEVRIGAWKTRPDLDVLGGLLKREGPMGAFLEIYAAEAFAHDKKVAFIRESRLYHVMALLGPYLGVVRFVYLHRDPRDMAASWKRSSAMRGGVIRAAGTWNDEQVKLLRVRSQLRISTGCEVPRMTYESLLEDPGKTLSETCEAIGLAFEPGMLEFHSTDRNLEFAATAAEWRNVGQPIMSANAGKFRRELTMDEIQYVESVCWDPMVALGYEPVTCRLNCDELRELRSRLALLEPWDKPAFAQLPVSEQERRFRQHEVLTRIRTRSLSISS